MKTTRAMVLGDHISPGDLLEANSDEERDRFLVATGFLALGAKPAKAMNNDFAMDVIADQIDVIGSGILGLGVACARCHAWPKRSRRAQPSIRSLPSDAAPGCAAASSPR